MKISENGLVLIKNFENFRSEKYLDVGNKWTIGYGHLIRPDETFDDPISEEEATTLLSQDISTTEEAIDNQVTVPLTQGEYDALVSLVYNWGIGHFERSEGLQKLNKGDYDGAWDEFEEVDEVGGKIIAGLVRRRNMEEKEWEAGGVA